MWNLKQCWKHSSALIAFHSAVKRAPSPRKRVGENGHPGRLHALSSGLPSFALLEPALRAVVCFFFFLASLDELSSRDNTPSFAALGGVWFGAPSEQRELGLAACWCLRRIPSLLLRIRVLGKQPGAIQLIISPNLHLFNSNGDAFHKCSQALNRC